jgi:RNA polymerase sigma-70 factor (ECF subfamily)
MEPAPSSAELIQQVNAGDPRAGAQLFARYAQRLARIAEQHLSRQLAGRVDGEDVVQSAFRTFFRRCAGGEFQIQGSGHLWRLLVRITLLKARAAARAHTAGIRDVRAEVPGGDAWLLGIIARDPTPQEAAALVDQIRSLLHGLPPAYCQVLEMRLEGRPPAEIATQLGVSRQTVYRALHLFQQRLGNETDEQI